MSGILDIIKRKNPEKDFEILKQIGSGTYGEVYKAREVKSGDLVALKIIKIEPGEDFNIIQQEIAILSECKHTNIVGYNGSYLRRDRLWIAMEYCGGGSLQDIYHVTGIGLNELQIAFVCREILKGLAYLHKRNKMHLDIKGANILLTDTGDVKLGVTLQLKGRPFILRPYWMAPEVAAVERKSECNLQCDIWAVGITAVELAETQPPMFDLHPMRALYLMTKRNFKPPGLQHKSKWSDIFHNFLKYTLQKDPRKRPTANELLKHEFVNRAALCAALMLPLITVLEAPPPKPKAPVDDTEEESEDEKEKENPTWLETAASDPHYKPRIQRYPPLTMARQLQTQRQFHHQTVQIIKSACLGIGSYGAVYKAICNELPCAAKILHSTLFETNDPGSRKIVERFDQECEFLSGVRHPNIVQYLGVTRDPESGLPVLLMELLDGNLTHFLEQSQKPLPYHIQVSLCYDVALALAYLHSNGIIHRDLSSNNILLIAGSRAKVTDFGMSKFTNANPRMTPLTMCPGTMVYMSPEALKEPPVYTEKLDCFSHGVLCIQIVTRQFPNPGQRTKTVPSPQSPTGRIEIPVLDTERRKSHIDQIDPNHPLLPIATDCLSYDEEDRPSAQQLCHHLAALQQAPQYGESVQQSQERSRPAQDTDREERERQIRELQQQQEEQVMEIQNLHLQTQASNQLQSKDQELQAPPEHSQKSSRYTDEASTPVYSNVDRPPVPPRRSRSVPPHPSHSVPPIPPRTRNAGSGQPSQIGTHSQSSPTDRRAYFSKVFNGCPLHLNCASSWYHPITKLQYILLGAEEGLFSLLVTNNPDPVMEQVSSRPCHWLRVVENALIWLSGHSRFVSMTNLILLFQTESQKESLQHRSHTARIPDSKGCYKCCIFHNPFRDQRYLIAAVPKGILLMQWYQPKHAFMHVMLFECQVPQPVHMIEALVQEDEEYPIVCFGLKESVGGAMIFNTLNLNSQASWFTDKPEGKDLPVLCVQQLEKDTIFIGLDRCAKFVDRNGILKPSSVQASQLTFEKKSDHMVFLSNCVLSFHKHGMQGKSLVTQQVTAEVADGSKVFHLLGSHGTIVIETRPSDDPTAPSNIYILVSEDSQQS